MAVLVAVRKRGISCEKRRLPKNCPLYTATEVVTAIVKNSCVSSYESFRVHAPVTSGDSRPETIDARNGDGVLPIQ